MISLGMAKKVTFIDGFNISGINNDDKAVIYVELFSAEFDGVGHVLARLYKKGEFCDVLYKAKDFTNMLDNIKNKVESLNK